MDLFENMDKIKDNMLQSLDKITDEKKTIYDQIKRLETEQYILNNNLEYFETYLNYLEFKKASNNSVSSNGNNFQINASDLKFEDFVNINYKSSSNKYKNDSNDNKTSSKNVNNNLEYDIKTNNDDILRDRNYYDNNLYDI